ncbi:MAG: hypothetical protein HW388_1794, partial [Dehalococcoidia bacterium]|nr:hypothetical protein [Dehalococcoidia bacterium]
MDGYGVFSGLVPILVIGGIIAAIVALARRRGGAEEAEEEEPGIGTLKRLYFYGLSFVALMVAAVGVTNMVDYVAERLFGSKALIGSEMQLALALSLTLVGTPVWLFFWSLAQRSTRLFPGETRALARKVYLYLVLGVSAAVVAFGLVSLLRWLLGAGAFNGTHVALPLAWGGVWAFHWRIETLEGQRTELTRSVRRLYAYITSLYGLVMLTKLLTSTGVALWSNATRTALSVALVGGLLWWWHWHRISRGDSESVLRRVYLYLFAILGGALTTVVSLSILLYNVLQWLIGEPDVASASAHFRFLPGVIAALTTGAGVWRYHWAVVQQESHVAPEGLLAARRVYRYIMAALGLATLATGLVFLFSTVLGVLVPEAREKLVSTDWWRNPLTLAITLIVVGAPLWRFYWFGVQQEAKTGGMEERVALSRRVFIYLVFSIAVLVTLGNMSALLFMLLRDLLEGQLSAQVLQETKWNIGTLLMAGTISVYYWLVLQEDRRATPT